MNKRKKKPLLKNPKRKNIRVMKLKEEKVDTEVTAATKETIKEV